jgi:cytoskeletal protein RodZ
LSEKSTKVAGVPSGGRRPAETEGPSLGGFLADAREKRGASREDVVRETRIPDHYVRMMESNDYSTISDQLYVLPFLRRYASFLALDPEETAMRFVREVQRADSTPSARSLEPFEMDRRKRRNWTGPAIATALIAVIVGAWLTQSHHRRQAGAAAASNATSDEKTAAP